MNKKQIFGLIAVVVVVAVVAAAVWWLVGLVAGMANTPETCAREFMAAAPLAATDQAALEKMRSLLTFDRLSMIGKWGTDTQTGEPKRIYDETEGLRNKSREFWQDNLVLGNVVKQDEQHYYARLLTAAGADAGYLNLYLENGTWKVAAYRCILVLERTSKLQAEATQWRIAGQFPR